MAYNNCILFTEYTKSLRNNDNRNGNPKGAYFCTHHKESEISTADQLMCGVQVLDEGSMTFTCH